VIRPAAREDARAIAELEVRAWRWAFVDIVEDALMPTVEDREARWTGLPLDGAFVAEVDGRVMGVVQVGPAPAQEGSPADGGAGAVGRLRGLHVEPAAQGAGLGAALHAHALDALQAAGYATATLWVFAANGHARGFYERRGWTADGEAGVWEGIPEVRLRHTLPA
jgi:GNAT superfamily N-acetyltransferase